MDRAVRQQPNGGGAASAVAEAHHHGGRPDPDARAVTARWSAHHPADPAVLRLVRRRVEAWADEHDVSAEDLMDLQLALGEAVSNGVEHAYRDTAPGTVEIEVQISAAQPRVLTARVRDHGRWRPVPARPGYRGRGLAMIDSLTRDMRVTSDAHGTEVAFTLPLSG